MAVRLTRGKEVLYAEDAAVGGGGGNKGGSKEKKEATPRGPQRPKAMVHEVKSSQSLCEHYRGALLAEEQRAEDLSQENHFLKQLLAKVHRGEVSPKELPDVVAEGVAGWVGWCWPGLSGWDDIWEKGDGGSDSSSDSSPAEDTPVVAPECVREREFCFCEECAPPRKRRRLVLKK